MYRISTLVLHMGWTINGSRVTCGPPQRLQWPAEAFRKNSSNPKFPPTYHSKC